MSEPRDEKFSLRVNAQERRAIKALADGLNRTQSDAVRVIVTEAARIVEETGGVEGYIREVALESVVSARGKRHES